MGQNPAENVRNTVGLQDLVAAGDGVVHLGTGNWTCLCSVNFDRTSTSTLTSTVLTEGKDSEAKKERVKRAL